MNGKDAVSSDSIRGSLVAAVSLVAMLAMQVFGYDIGDQITWVEGLTGLGGLIGVAWAMWGRYKATEPITSIAGKSIVPRHLPQEPFQERRKNQQGYVPKNGLERRKANMTPTDY